MKASERYKILKWAAGTSDEDLEKNIMIQYLTCLGTMLKKCMKAAMTWKISKKR